MKVLVSKNGRITIPKALRDRFGIYPGQVLEVREDGGCLVMTKIHPQDSVDRVYGILKLSCSTDVLLNKIRGRVDSAK